MDIQEDKYAKYKLCCEMFDTIDMVKNFNIDQTTDIAKVLLSHKRLLITGEGSSRIFPAKNLIYKSLKSDIDFNVYTEGATQAMEYNLKDCVVFCVSNSGKTKEVVRLMKKLKDESHGALYGMTTNAGTPIDNLSKEAIILNCGWEQAVAATKSVVEQALVFDSLLANIQGVKMSELSNFADKLEKTLLIDIPEEIIRKGQNAGTIYFAGRNNGVAEELTLKTNEIIRKKSDFLEGTYAVHGIEEVMTQNDFVVLINPFKDEEEKFDEVLHQGVGLNVIAIAPRETRFQTIVIPEDKKFQEYLELVAGWNLLVEIGIAFGIDLDTAERARKIGNEIIE